MRWHKGQFLMSLQMSLGDRRRNRIRSDTWRDCGEIDVGEAGGLRVKFKACLESRQNSFCLTPLVCWRVPDDVSYTGGRISQQ